MRPRPRWGQGWRKGVIITMKRGFLQNRKKGIGRIRNQCFRRAMNARQMAPMMTAGSTGDAAAVVTGSA
jgi:hypothetical protein